LEEVEDDRVEEVLPASSSDEEPAPADKDNRVLPPKMKKKSTAQPSETSEEVREKMTALTVSKPEATERGGGRTTTAAPKSGKDRRATRSLSLSGKP
jgi:hypothetical protein